MGLEQKEGDKSERVKVCEKKAKSSVLSVIR